VEGGAMSGREEKKAIPSANLRNGVIRLLRLFSSETEQLEYQQNVPSVNVCVEFICMWFNDYYCDPEHNEFKSAFTEGELGALAHFNKFYSERYKILPYVEHHPGIRHSAELDEWLRSAVWREIMAEATRALGAFPESEIKVS
jgi:hypothetical protein